MVRIYLIALLLILQYLSYLFFSFYFNYAFNNELQNCAAKYVGKSEGKGWTYQQVKSMITESVQMSESVNSRELQRLAEEESEMYPLGPTLALAYQAILNDCVLHSLNEGTEVKRLGGLHVIGTSLHESRRIDNQVSDQFKSFLYFEIYMYLQNLEKRKEKWECGIACQLGKVLGAITWCSEK